MDIRVAPQDTAMALSFWQNLRSILIEFDGYTCTFLCLAGLHKFFACNQMPGDAWKSRSTIITPKSDPCENGMTTSSFASGCRRKGQRAAGELVLKQLGCYWYEMCSVINIGGCEVSDLIVNILFKVAQAVDPKAFQRLKNRHIDTIRNTAIALMYQRVTALYHLKLKTPESSELDMLRFYSHSLVVAPEDALRAFARVVHFVDRTDDDLDLAAALRSLITFDHGKPETSNDGRYYMLSITTGSEDRTVMSQLPGKAEYVVKCELSCMQKVLYRQLGKLRQAKPVLASINYHTDAEARMKAAISTFYDGSEELAKLPAFIAAAPDKQPDAQ